VKSKWPELIKRLEKWAAPFTGITQSGRFIREDVRRLLDYVKELEKRIDDD